VVSAIRNGETADLTVVPQRRTTSRAAMATWTPIQTHRAMVSLAKSPPSTIS